MTDYTLYWNSAREAFHHYYSGHRTVPPAADHDHVINIARNILLARDGIQTGGHFVSAIICNDLQAAVERADSVCIQHLGFFLNCKLYVQPKKI